MSDDLSRESNQQLRTLAALAARSATTNIDWSVSVPFGLAALAGALTGGRIATRLDPVRSLRWFAGLLVAVAVLTAGDAVAG